MIRPRFPRFFRSFRKLFLIIVLGAAYLAYRNGRIPQPDRKGAAAPSSTRKSSTKNTTGKPRKAGAGKARKPDTLRGTAVRIKDGDTFVLLMDDRTTEDIRMLGIDAPEKKQDFGAKSKDAFGELLRNAPLTVVVADRDRYNRAVASVYDADNRWVNEAMVRQGMAWMYRAYTEDTRLSVAEAKAQVNRVGLWSQPNPTPPWDWRKMAK